MFHADLPLALRLERVSAGINRDCAEAHPRIRPDSPASWIAFGSGVATFIDEGSPLTQIKGAGMAAPTLEADLDTVEEFYEERGAPVSIVMCPFADAALFTYLSRRNYEIGAFENTLVRRVSAADITSDADVVEAGDAGEWSRVVAESFFEIASPGGIELGETLFHVPTCRNLIIRASDVPAAAAQVDIREGVATLQCDGTIRRFREVGLQKKLIQARLSLAAEAGCDLATADTAPGSLSQRNYEKLGFQVIYTKLTLVKG